MTAPGLSTLDEAWKAAEAALPEGFSLTIKPWLDDRLPEHGGHLEWRYHAYPSRVYTVRIGFEDRPTGSAQLAPFDGYGDTPAAALQALAVALAKTPGEPRT
jgi:hypothetical protein